MLQPDNKVRNEGISRTTGGFSLPKDHTAPSGIDLNRQLMIHPNSTFVFRVNSDAMKGIGINKGDTVLVDRAIVPKHDQIVLAVVDEEYLVRRFYASHDTVKLLPENSRYQAITQREDREIIVWGVVVTVIRKLIGG